MKVLFLDIDGVMKDDHTWHYETEHFDEYLKKNFLLEDKFVTLAEICKKYDLKVVVSSAWKCNAYYGNNPNFIENIEEKFGCLRELRKLLNKYGIEFYGYTPDVPNPGEQWCQNMCKEYDITAFLIEHPEVTDYVIVDDLFENDLYTLKNHLLQTKYNEDGKGNGGLLPHHIEDIKKYIQPREEVIPEKMEDNPLYKQIKYSEFGFQDCGSFGLMKTFDDVTIHISLSFDYKTVFYHWYDNFEYKRGKLNNYEEFIEVLRFINVVETPEDVKKLERKC